MKKTELIKDCTCEQYGKLFEEWQAGIKDKDGYVIKELIVDGDKILHVTKEKEDPLDHFKKTACKSVNELAEQIYIHKNVDWKTAVDMAINVYFGYEYVIKMVDAMLERKKQKE